MIKKCTENGALFSCFQNFGKIDKSTECNEVCNYNDLNQLGLDDFYNFHRQLNQSNFLIKVWDATFGLFHTKHVGILDYSK